MKLTAINVSINEGVISFKEPDYAKSKNITSFKYSLLKNNHPEVCSYLHDVEEESRQIKVLFYTEDVTIDSQNYILFNDNTTVELPKICLNIREIYYKRGDYLFEYEEEVRCKRRENKRKIQRLILTKPLEIFKAPFEDRVELLNQFLLEAEKEVYTPEEMLAYLNVYKRRALDESDWTQLNDVQAVMTQEEKDNWAEYRAQLRVLDNTTDPLGEVMIPTPPEDPAAI